MYFYEFVDKVKNELNNTLTKNLYCRPHKNDESHFITCPTFQDAQRASKLDQTTSYRVGLKLEHTLDGFEIGISSIFSHCLLDRFSRNTTPTLFLATLRKLLKLGPVAIWWDSKKQLNDSLKNHTRNKFKALKFSVNLEIKTIKEFRKHLEAHKILEKNFMKDWRCNPPSDSKKKIRGGSFHFYVKLKELDYISARKAVRILTPLFLNFYSKSVLTRREAALRRALDQKFKKENRTPICAFKGCKVTERSYLDGGHIQRHADGGSDKAFNGIYVCNYKAYNHHTKTEGLPLSKLKKLFKVKEMKGTVLDSGRKNNKGQNKS